MYVVVTFGRCLKFFFFKPKIQVEMWQILFNFLFQNLTIIFIFIVCMLSCGFCTIIDSSRVFGGMASLHSFRANRLQVVYSPSTGQLDGYSMERDFRLKPDCSHTHRLEVPEILPVHHVILSSDILWLTGYVP